MDASSALNVAVSALGGCIVAIGWWIGTSLNSLNDKMEKVLVRLESHEAKLTRFELWKQKE